MDTSALLINSTGDQIPSYWIVYYYDVIMYVTPRVSVVLNREFNCFELSYMGCKPTWFIPIT